MLEKIYRNVFKKPNAHWGLAKLFFTGLEKIIYFFIVPIVTTYLSKSEYGVLQTYLSWVQVLSILLGLSLGSYIRSSFHKKGFNTLLFKETINTYNFIVLAITLPIIVFVYFISGYEWIMTFGIICVIQAVFSNILNNEKIYSIVFMRFKREIYISNLGSILASLLTLLLFYSFTSNFLYLRILSFTIIAVLGVTFFLLNDDYRFRFDKDYFIEGVKKSSPLVLHSLSIILLYQVDRTFLLEFLGAKETGIYSFAQLVASIPLMIAVSLESLWIPFFNKNFLKNKMESIKKYFYVVLFIFSLLFLVIMSLSSVFIDLLSDSKFHESLEFIPILTVSNFLIFGYAFFVHHQLLTDRFKLITKI